MRFSSASTSQEHPRSGTHTNALRLHSFARSPIEKWPVLLPHLMLLLLLLLLMLLLQMWQS